MQAPLTEQEENFLKDVLKFVANESTLHRSMALVLKLTNNEFEALSDSCWKKLQNGRITIIDDSPTCFVSDCCRAEYRVEENKNFSGECIATYTVCTACGLACDTVETSR